MAVAATAMIRSRRSDIEPLRSAAPGDAGAAGRGWSAASPASSAPAAAFSSSRRWCWSPICRCRSPSAPRWRSSRRSRSPASSASCRRRARIDWLLLVTLTLLALTGMAGGLALGRRVSGAKLRAGFGWFVLAMSVGHRGRRGGVVVARALREDVRRMWLPLLGAFFIGLSKSGFATGLGMLTTPLVATRDVGATGDRHRAAAALRRRRLTMGLYWKKWDAAAVRAPLVGALVGIGFGMLFVNRVSNKTLGLAIGIVGLTMVLLLMIRARWYPDHVLPAARDRSAARSASSAASRRRSPTPPARSSRCSCWRSSCRRTPSSPPTRCSSPSTIC